MKPNGTHKNNMPDSVLERGPDVLRRQPTFGKIRHVHMVGVGGIGNVHLRDASDPRSSVHRDRWCECVGKGLGVTTSTDSVTR